MLSLGKRSAAWVLVAAIVSVAATPLLRERLRPEAQAGWQQVHPIVDAGGRQIDLLDVHVLNSNRIHAVGKNGTILRSNDFGASWTRQTSGVTGDLYGITMRGDTGVAVGDWGRILRTTNGGQLWTDVTPRNVGGYILPGRDFRLYRVAHAGPTYIFAVGGLAPGHVGAFSLRSTDAGATWTDVTPRTVNVLKSLDLWSANNGYAVGGVYTAEYANPGFALVCCPGAQGRWKDYTPPPPGEHDPNFHYPLGAVAVGNAQTAYIFHNKDNYYKTTTGGRRWIHQGQLQADCYHFDVRDADFWYTNAGLVVGDYGIMLRTDDGGTSWNQLRRRTRVSLAAVSMLDDKHAAVVGPGMTALTTRDGGVTWTGSATQTTRHLNAISFHNASVGIAVGDGGDILRTSDGGQTWTSASTVNIWRGLQYPLNGVDMIDANTAVAVGDAAILRTTDGGDTWSQMTAPPPSDVSPPSQVSFLDSQQGLAVGGSTILGTSDGSTWTVRYTSDAADRLQDVHFVTAGLAVVVGDNNTILRSTDGGLSWSPISISGSIAPTDLLAVYFVNSTTGWAVGSNRSTYAGVIIKTTDGGVTWQAQSHPSRIALRDVYMATPTVGLIVGGDRNRAIILRTNNGVSWVEHAGPVGGHHFSTHMLNANQGLVVGTNGRILRITL